MSDDSEDKARAATIFDVARLAGVSHQTVSRVVNELPNVRPATRQRVEHAIQQLRYRPSPAARALVTRRSRTIGLITSGGADFGPSSISLSFNRAAREARYAVSIASIVEHDPTSMRSALELLVRQNVEAIVLIAARTSMIDEAQSIEVGVPLVATASADRSGLHTVSIDHYAGARLAVRHLIELGHREIRHLSGPADSIDAAERVRGWRDELAAHRLRVVEPAVGDWTPSSGYRFGLELAADIARDAPASGAGSSPATGSNGPTGPAERSGSSALDRATGVFTGNDQMALGLVHAITSAGLAAPRDLSIVGFDDIPEAEHFLPPLTTLRQDFTGFGRDLMSTVLAVLGDTDASDPAPRVPELVVRDSTARPRT
jgi:DNA-binding LacI/PurR family transcriptional regulator